MKKKDAHNEIYGWLLIAPFVMTLIIFFLYASVRVFYFSFTEYNLINKPVWVGASNFFNLFKEELFLIALRNTVAFSIIVTTIQTALALGLAIILNTKMRAKTFFRTSFYVPSILSSAAITLIFVWLYQRTGYLNTLLSSIVSNLPKILCFMAIVVICQFLLVLRDKRKHIPISWLDGAWLFMSILIALIATFVINLSGWLPAKDYTIAINWLNTQKQVGPLPLTLWAVVIQNIYTTVPTLMLLFLAGLQGIPKDLYEAADLDGASIWQQHWYITIPALTPVSFLVLTLGIIGTLQMFDQVALLGASAPLESRITLAYYIYHEAFSQGGHANIGFASAASLVLLVLTLFMIYVQKTFGIKEKANDK